MAIRLQPTDIVTMASENNPLGTQTSQVSELMTVIQQRLGAIPAEWLSEGVEANCFILELGGGWQPGRVRLTLEFEPAPTPVPTPAAPASAATA